MKPLRIGFVSPFPPIKGGIARFSGLLRDALPSEGYELLPLSFRKLYPDFLSKGAAEGPPLSSEGGLVLFNPFSWLRAIGSIRAAKPDIILFSYWTGLLAPLCWLIRRIAGVRVVVLLHNLSAHDPFFFEPLMTRLLARSADAYLTLSGAVSKELASEIPQSRMLQLFHPPYGPAGEGDTPSRAEARRALGLDEAAPVLLFYGYVRRYKGLELLLRAMAELLRREPSLKLLVAGEFHEDIGRYRRLIMKLDLAGSVELRPGYVSAEESARLFAATDAVVLPYRRATQSGVAELAYACGVPVIVTPVGSLADAVQHGVTGWVAPVASPEGISAAVEEFLESRSRLPAIRLAIAEYRRACSWEAFALEAGRFLETEARRK
ncbi:MAG: glycosyltransferase [Chlorobiaceae bacterium]